MLGTGLRLGEALALEWGPGGLDADAGLVRVRRSLDRVRGRDGRYAFLPPKSRASRRDVPLTPEDARRVRRHRLASGRPPDGALVFAGRDGEPLSPLPAYRAFKRACDQGGLLETVRVRPGQWLELADRRYGPGALVELGTKTAREQVKAGRVELVERLPHPHDARHSFATHALAAGLSPHAVAALLGHSDAGLVLRRYGHALPDEVAGAGEALSAWRRSRGVGLDHEWITAAAASQRPLHIAT